MIEIITPAGFEKFFREVADVVERGDPDPVSLETLTASYGLFFDDAWVPELVERYNLRNPFE